MADRRIDLDDQGGMLPRVEGGTPKPGATAEMPVATAGMKEVAGRILGLSFMEMTAFSTLLDKELEHECHQSVAFALVRVCNAIKDEKGDDPKVRPPLRRT